METGFVAVAVGEEHGGCVEGEFIEVGVLAGEGKSEFVRCFGAV